MALSINGLRVDQIDTLTISELDAMLVTGINFPWPADTGSYAVTGNVTGLTYGKAYHLDALHGTYYQTVYQVGLKVVRHSIIEDGTYGVTGHSVGFFRDPFITINPGIYLATGHDVGLVKGSSTDRLDSGNYLVTGHSVGLARTREVAIDSGSYLTTGHDADLLFDGTPPGDVLACLGEISGQIIVGDTLQGCVACPN